jgi:glutathione synthase/RimK-type ligase-like ATP-grasp enzyme
MNFQTENTRCLLKASSDLGFSFEVFDENKNLILIKTSKGNLWFSNFNHPFNDQALVSIAKDKNFTYRILGNIVSMPRHVPILDKNYYGGTNHDYSKEIANAVSELGLPLVVKPNSLSKSTNVSLCNSKDEVLNAISNIFSDNKNYDYVALLQKPINTKYEFRVVVFKNDIVLVYSREEWVKDESLIKKIKDFIDPIKGIFDLGFVGMDIILDNEDRFWLLEINTAIGFKYFIEKHGEVPIVDLYKNIFKNYL